MLDSSGGMMSDIAAYNARKLLYRRNLAFQSQFQLLLDLTYSLIGSNRLVFLSISVLLLPFLFFSFDNNNFNRLFIFVGL